MRAQKTRNFYAILYPNRNFNDSLALIRKWNTAQLLRFASKAEREAAVANDGRIVPCSAKTAKYIAGESLVCVPLWAEANETVDPFGWCSQLPEWDW